MFPEYQGTSGYEQQVQGQQGEGATTDYESIIAEQRQILEQQGDELKHVRHEFDGFRRKSLETEGALDRIRKALNPDDQERKPDPRALKSQRYEGDLDAILAESLKADRQGKSIPLTTKIGSDFYQFALEAQQREAEYERKISEMERKLETVMNPDRNLDNQAGLAMEGMLQSAMATVYGSEAESQPIRQAQFDASAKLIVNEINRLKREDPESWNRIRRNPADQQKMVSHFVKLAIPPKAREMLEMDHIRSTEMTEGELMAAWQQAKEQYQKNPSPYWDQVISDLRGELLQLAMPGGARRRGVANRMVSGGY